jgi:hypothetical protein
MIIKIQRTQKRSNRKIKKIKKKNNSKRVDERVFNEKIIKFEKVCVAAVIVVIVVEMNPNELILKI